MSARVTPGTADTASCASATINHEKFGEQKNVGSRNRTVATTPDPSGSSDTVHDLTNSSEVMGSSSSGSSTVSSAAQTASRRTPFMPVPRRASRRR